MQLTQHQFLAVVAFLVGCAISAPVVNTESNVQVVGEYWKPITTTTTSFIAHPTSSIRNSRAEPVISEYWKTAPPPKRDVLDSHCIAIATGIQCTYIHADIEAQNSISISKREEQLKPEYWRLTDVPVEKRGGLDSHCVAVGDGVHCSYTHEELHANNVAIVDGASVVAEYWGTKPPVHKKRDGLDSHCVATGSGVHCSYTHGEIHTNSVATADGASAVAEYWSGTKPPAHKKRGDLDSHCVAVGDGVHCSYTHGEVHANNVAVADGTSAVAEYWGTKPPASQKRDALDSHCASIVGGIQCKYSKAEVQAEGLEIEGVLQKACERTAEGVTCTFNVGGN